MSKKPKTQPDDLLVHWRACGSMQVSSASDQSKWYSITVDKCGNLACECESAKWRPWDPCKHAQRAAEHIETVPATTPGQVAFAKRSNNDRARWPYQRMTDPDRVDEVEPEPEWWTNPDAMPPMPPEPEPSGWGG